MLNIKRVGFVVIGMVLSLYAGMVAAEVVAVVSAKTPVAMLSKNQVGAIFLGKTDRFPDGSQAVPVDQAEGSAERSEFYLHVADKSPALLKAYWSKIIFTGRGQPPQEVANSAEVKQHIVKNPNAIGYIERNMVDDSVKVVLVP